MHVLISSARDSAALRTHSGSARNGRASDTRSAPPGEHRLGDVGHVDPVRRDDRHRHVLLERARHTSVNARAGHRGDDGRHPSLVPADAEVEDARAGLLDLRGERGHLVPGLALLDEVEHRDAVDDDEVASRRPRARRARSRRRTGAASRGCRPTRRSRLVGARGEELVDQVALGPHDLDAVVARPRARAGAPGRRRAIWRRTPRSDRARGREPADRALHRRRRDAPGGERVAARVQDLQRDPAARLVHGIRDLAVLARLAAGGQLRGQRGRGCPPRSARSHP